MPTRFFYGLAVLLVGIVVMAILWFALFSASGVFPIIRSAARNVTYDLGLNSTAYDQADTLFQNIASYFLILCLLSLILTVFVYAQRRRAVEAMYG